MKVVVCKRDGFMCNLDPQQRKCRHIKEWQGRCSERIERTARDIEPFKTDEDRKKKATPELFPLDQGAM